jgi:hypothetical protein
MGKPAAVSAQRDVSFLQTVEALRARLGSLMLGDDDLLLLAYEEISRTTTYEEQAYHADRSCAV